ncbi:MAG: sensor histidine kinase [Erysipelothrix sp.]
MKIKDFIRDKLYLCVLVLGIIGILTFFLAVLGIQKEIIIIIDAFLIVILVTVLVTEYGRRAVYYQELLSNLETLDQKYLISELVQIPNFMDGVILHDILKQSNKSMVDQVRTYQTLQEDYKEYIELWIHEVKTPLSGAKLMVSNHPSSFDKDLMRELNRVEDYLEQALFYARSNAVEKDYMIQAVNLGMYVRNVMKQFASIFIQKQIHLELGDLDCAVYSDPKWLEFILKQIVDNALKYVSAETGSIRINAEEKEQSVVLTIIDNGPGIPSSDLPRVFERGFTGSLGRYHKQATGMGLFLVKRLCDKLEIDINIESEIGVGTSVQLIFPKSDMMFK